MNESANASPRALGRWQGRGLAALAGGLAALALPPFDLWPILFPFRYIGFEVYEPEIFNGVGGVAFIEGQDGGLNTLDVYSNRWTEALAGLPARSLVPYNRDSDFGENKQLVQGAPEYSPFVRHTP